MSFEQMPRKALALLSALMILAGLALAAPCYAAYNYLVARVNSIVLDMEKSSTEILSALEEMPAPENTAKRA
jgi:biopolymer transport protein ExbB